VPAQLNAPHAHQPARFTACSASRRPAGNLRQAVLLNAAPAGSLAGALKLNAPLLISVRKHAAVHSFSLARANCA